jgi:hypothetical protein
MADKGDITFTFDASSFKTGMENISKQMKNLTTNTNNLVQKVSKGTSMALVKIGAMATAIVGAFKGAMSVVRDFLPEIGTSFEIAKNIVLKNLLWPLRKELLPMLQKMLDWVRKNRAMFLEWGGVIVNVFKTVQQVFRSIFAMLDPVVKPIKDLIKSIFGDTAKSITDTVNLVLVKIVAFTIFIEDLLRPVFEGIGKVIKGVIEVIKSFAQGFIDGFKKLFDDKNGIGALQLLSDTFTSLGKALETIAPAFKFIGELLGTVFAGGINLAIDALKILLFTLKAVYDLIANPKNAGKIFAELGKNLLVSVKDMGAHISKTFGGEVDLVKGLFKKDKVDDAIITKDGKVIKTNPQDSIIATKNPGGMGKSISLSMSFGDFHLTTTEGNAQTAGENFVRGMERQMRNVLLNNLALEGTS